jgi:Flp pilus assembly protein TadB
MAVLAWFGCGAIFLIALGWSSNAYFFAQRRARGESLWPGPFEMFGPKGSESLHDLLHTQGDSGLERKRRRVWIAFGALAIYMVFGGWFWFSLARLVAGH